MKIILLFLVPLVVLSMSCREQILTSQKIIEIKKSQNIAYLKYLSEFIYVDTINNGLYAFDIDAIPPPSASIKATIKDLIERDRWRGGSSEKDMIVFTYKVMLDSLLTHYNNPPFTREEFDQYFALDNYKLTNDRVTNYFSNARYAFNTAKYPDCIKNPSTPCNTDIGIRDNMHCSYIYINFRENKLHSMNHAWFHY